MAHCTRMTAPARHNPPEPPEFCDNDSLPGEDVCEFHLEETAEGLRETLQKLRDDIAESELRQKACEAAGMHARAAVHARRARNAATILDFLTGVTKVPAPGYEPLTAEEAALIGVEP
ncbi:hypothetical protein ACMX2H_15985 [Arthrobacter sulfonylureivorans]|uniref:hypothetical protein n=1 Tax=Arthrobacter sulfonylureivorans TaxID=2486855 RepID=UPI0039E38279